MVRRPRWTGVVSPNIVVPTGAGVQKVGFGLDRGCTRAYDKIKHGRRGAERVGESDNRAAMQDRRLRLSRTTNSAVTRSGVALVNLIPRSAAKGSGECCKRSRSSMKSPWFVRRCSSVSTTICLAVTLRRSRGPMLL
jgi:hypothetical protein